jgi:hypothetical protein
MVSLTSLDVCRKKMATAIRILGVFIPVTIAAFIFGIDTTIGSEVPKLIAVMSAIIIPVFANVIASSWIRND